MDIDAIYISCMKVLSPSLMEFIRTGDSTSFESAVQSAIGIVSSSQSSTVKIEDPYPFEKAWELYDKKVDRKKSESKWNRLSKRDREAAMQAIPLYVAATPDKQYRKNFSTYLNNRSWENEIINRDSIAAGGRDERARSLAEVLSRGDVTDIPF